MSSTKIELNKTNNSVQFIGFIWGI